VNADSIEHTGWLRDMADLRGRGQVADETGDRFDADICVSLPVWCCSAD
jgi:hypothetical protein